MSNKNTLVTFFETGDVPQASQFADLINSSVNLFETGDQSMLGALVTTQLVTPQVSATNVNVTGTLTATNSTFTAATVIATTISANAGFFNTHLSVSGHVAVNGIVSANALNVTGDVSAATGTVYSSAHRSSFNYHGTPLIVSAAGTTQASGALLTAEICRLQGATDGQTTGFVITANQTGWVQYLANECAVSSNLWPPTGGLINGLGANAPFPMVANTPYIIIHRAASAYSVK